MTEKEKEIVRQNLKKEMADMDEEIKEKTE